LKKAKLKAMAKQKKTKKIEKMFALQKKKSS